MTQYFDVAREVVGKLEQTGTDPDALCALCLAVEQIRNQVQKSGKDEALHSE